MSLYRLKFRPIAAPHALLQISLCLATLLLTQAKAHAVGVFLTNEFEQVVQVDEKAAIAFDGKTETLILSPTYAYNSMLEWNFIWLIAVPAEPKVEVAGGLFFPEMEKLIPSPDPAFDPHEPDNLAGINRYKVFRPSEVAMMKGWITQSGYRFPKLLEAQISDYGAKGWHFVALEVDGVHVQQRSTDVLKIIGARIVPVKITFATEKPIYPRQLTSTEPDPDSIAAPFGMEYGKTFENAGGNEPNPRADAMLSRPSERLYPALPVGLLNLKTELFYFGRYPARIEGLHLVDGKRIDGESALGGSWHSFFLGLPPGRIYVSRFFGATAVRTLSDIEIESGPGVIDSFLDYFSLLAISFAIFGLGSAIILIIRRKINEPKLQRVAVLAVMMLTIAGLAEARDRKRIGQESEVAVAAPTEEGDSSL